MKFLIAIAAVVVITLNATAQVVDHYYLDPENGDTFMPLTIRVDNNLTLSSVRSSFADVGNSARVSKPVPVAPSCAGLLACLSSTALLWQAVQA